MICLQDGGLGGLKYPLLADFNKTISRDYGVLVESAGVALRSAVTLFRLPIGTLCIKIAVKMKKVSGNLCMKWMFLIAVCQKTDS